MWNLKWDMPALTTKQVRRAFLMSETPACWLVKWGGKYDITYTDGSMLPTNLTRVSDLTLLEWVQLANKLKSK